MAEAEKTYLIGETLGREVINYLGKCPYRDVFKMVAGLQGLPQVKPAEGPDEEKGKEKET